jgi:hypothetical protein
MVNHVTVVIPAYNKERTIAALIHCNDVVFSRQDSKQL